MKKTENRKQKTEYRIQNTEDRIPTPDFYHLSSIFYFLSYIIFNFLPLVCCLIGCFAAAALPCYGAQSFKSSIQNSKFYLLSAVSYVPAKEEGEQAKKDKLQQLITQIRTIKFEQEKQAPDSSRKADSQPTIQPRRIKAFPANEPNAESLQFDSHFSMLDEYRVSNIEKQVCSAQTVQMLENLTQQPDQIHDPLRLAEILYISGNLKQAAPVYQHALNRTEPNDVSSAVPDRVGDKAWILFQIGNCLRDSDPLAAKKIYRQLITEYPNCSWTELAKSRMSLIDWFLNEKPQNLIAESKF